MSLTVPAYPASDSAATNNPYTDPGNIVYGQRGDGSGVVTSTVDALMKEIYQGQIREQLNTEIIGWKRIEKTSQGVTSEVGGKYVTFPLRVGRNHGIGYRNELEKLQDPGHQSYNSVRLGLKYGYGRLRITGQTMELARTNTQAFANVMDREVSGIRDDIAKDVARIFYSDGSGTLATGTAAGVVDSPRNLEKGMPVQLVHNGTAAAATTVSTVNYATGAVTLGTGAVAAGDTLIRPGNQNREPNGLANLVCQNTEPVHGLDPDDEPLWKSVIKTATGALSETAMIKMVDDIRVNGGRVSAIFTSLGVRRAYFNLLVQQRRYTDVKTFDGGMQGLAFHSGREIPVVEDIDAPAGKMWFLDESTFKIYRSSDWSWLDTDGRVWKWVPNYDAFEAVLHSYWEFGVDRRNANGLLDGVTEA